MTCNWPEISLADIYDIRSGLSKPASAFGSGFPFLSFKEVFGNYFVPEELSQLVESSEKERANGSIKRGDVFLTRTSETMHELGMSSVALKDYKNATFNGFTKRLRPKEGTPHEVHPEFVGYYFRSPRFRTNMLAFSTLSTRASLNNDMITRLTLPLPPIDIQKKIAKILKCLDDKVSVNSKMNQTLEEMAQAIFKSWFVDFDPIKAKMNGQLPEGMDEATASLFPDKLVESELGLIPEGWEAKPLGDYLTIKRGGSPRPIKEFIVPEGYPWTKIADATANDNPYIFKTKEFIKEEGLKKTVYLKKGTLILSNSATPGLPRFLELDACIHDGWLHFPEKKHFTDSYLYQLFLHIRKHLVAQGNGSVFTNLKTDILRNQVVLVPPKELVDIYEKHASKFLEIVKAKSIESNQLAQLRDTLLPKLLSGEIELSAEL